MEDVASSASQRNRRTVAPSAPRPMRRGPSRAVAVAYAATAVAAMTATLVMPAAAATYSWRSTTSGNWADASRWGIQGGGTYPHAPGDLADIEFPGSMGQFTI